MGALSTPETPPMAAASRKQALPANTVLMPERRAPIRLTAAYAVFPTLGYRVQPLSVVVNGRFGQVNDFMHSLRKLVTVQQGKLDASGRLFAIDTVELAQSETMKFPNVQASVTLDAFVYAGGAGTQGSTTDPSDTTTPPAPGGAVAAGATP